MELKLLTNDEPILAHTASRVLQGEPDLSEILEFMWFEMDRQPTGVGLAAPQVNVPLQIFVLRWGGLREVFINPVIFKTSKNMMPSTEECLSCPGIKLKVYRHKQITIGGYDEHWVPFKRKLQKFPAVICQHEMDHLNGITILHRSREERVAK